MIGKIRKYKPTSWSLSNFNQSPEPSQFSELTLPESIALKLRMLNSTYMSDVIATKRISEAVFCFFKNILKIIKEIIKVKSCHLTKIDKSTAKKKNFFFIFFTATIKQDIASIEILSLLTESIEVKHIGFMQIKKVKNEQLINLA